MEKTKLLIIDDEEEFAKTLAERLELRGYETEICFDGKTGLEKAIKEKFDVIILDLKLPMLSGAEVLKRIRKHNLDTPIILLTGYDISNEFNEFLKFQSVKFVFKPVDIKELLKKIKEVLKSHE